MYLYISYLNVVLLLGTYYPLPLSPSFTALAVISCSRNWVPAQDQALGRTRGFPDGPLGLELCSTLYVSRQERQTFFNCPGFTRGAKGCYLIGSCGLVERMTGVSPSTCSAIIVRFKFCLDPQKACKPKALLIEIILPTFPCVGSCGWSLISCTSRQ